MAQNPPTSSSPAPQNGASNATNASGGAATTSQQPPQSGLFSKFDIPEAVRKQHPTLIPLILETESMNDDERQYWFSILPIMTDEQVKKLREILDNEKQQLAKLDHEYSDEVKRINSKHVAEWKAFQSKEKRDKRKATESQHEAEEKQKEEELLKNLQGI